MLPVKKRTQPPYALAEKLGLPEDVLLRAAKLTITAGRRALIENHRGVLEYSGERIVAAAERGRICVMGTELRIKAMNRTELLICGKIQSVEWE